jgi:hypothetical protein
MGYGKNSFLIRTPIGIVDLEHVPLHRQKWDAMNHAHVAVAKNTKSAMVHKLMHVLSSISLF